MGMLFNLQRFAKTALKINSAAMSYNGHYYYVYNNVADTWDEAKSFCKTRGGYLASINNATEDTALFNYIKSKGYSSAYFGLTDEDDEGNWTWVNGDSVKYLNCGSDGEPNGGTYENYGMYYYLYPNGEWNDGAWGVELTTFICEWELPNGLNLNSSGKTITASKKFKSGEVNLTDYPKVKNFDGSKLAILTKITGTSSNNSISGGSKTDSLYGGAGNDSLVGNAGNDKLFGEAGNDTLVGGTGNDTLTGGKGNDVFVHTKGKDVITDYTAGADVIKLQDSTIKSWKTSKKDVIFTTTTGQITVKNGKGKAISILETKTYASSSAFLVENNFAVADNLSAIVAEKSVGEVELTKPEKISQENLITFTAK